MSHRPFCGFSGLKPTLAALLAGGTLFGLYLSSLYSYLLFHSLAELFSIVIATGIFMMAWNSRRFLKNDCLLLLGIAYLFVGALDLLHTLAYKGMGVFSGFGTNLPTQLWIAARYLESVSLLLAPLLLRRQLKAELILAGYASFTLLLLLSIFAWPVFPDCFVEGTGLTTFKRASEYLICLSLGGAIWLLERQRDAFDPQVLRWLIWSLVLTIASELAFTLYARPDGLVNLTGHYLKIVSFYFIYKAIIETGLAKPYLLLFREVKESEAALRSAQGQLLRANEQLEQKVQERTAKLREIIADLEQFSYSISHDMRAPLRSMNSFAGFLMEDCQDKLSAQGKDYLVRIISAAERLDSLIRDVLTYNRVARGEVVLQPVDLDQLVRDIVEQYPNLDSARVQVGVASPLSAVIGNTALLTQCISNLLDNAAKFVAPGIKPRVRLWSEEREGKVRLFVRDNGIGMKPEHLDRIWRIFERLHHPHEYTGTGIGLSVVKRAVERMGGSLGVESAPGQGSTFWIELTAAYPHGK